MNLKLLNQKYLQKYSLLLFIVWSLWISAEFLMGPYSHVRIHDNGDGAIPALIASKIQFQKYGLSYYADYMATGVDASAQALTPLSNIISLFFILLPGWLAYGLLMFLQRLLASYFMYRLARDSLKFSIYPAVVAGLLFSLFNFSIYSFTLYHALGLPALAFIIWVLEKINLKNSPKRYLYLIIFGSFVGYTNYFVYFTPYLLPFIFLWFIVIKPTNNIKTIINLMIFSLFTVPLMLPNIMAIFYNSQLSQRTIFNLNSKDFSLQGRYLLVLDRGYSIITSYWPTFLILILPLLKFKLKNKLSNKLLSAFIFLVLIPIFYKVVQPNLANLPGIIKSFSFDRFELIIPFVLALTVASFLNLFPKRKIKFIFIFSITLIIIASIKVKVETLRNYAPYRSLYLHPDLVDLSKSVDSSKWRVATITGGGTRPAYALANGLYTVDAYLTLYPNAYHHFWADVIKDRIINDKSRYEDFIDWGNRVYLYGPDDFESPNNIKFAKYYNLDLLSLANVKYIISAKAIDDQSLVLRHSTYREEISQWSKWTLLKKIQYFLTGKFFGRPLYIYENMNVVPKFYIQSENNSKSESVKVDKYSPDKIELTANTENDANLITSINYYPYWEIYVNGKKQKIDLHEGTFMSTIIKKGENKVLLFYNPPYKLFQ